MGNIKKVSKIKQIATKYAIKNLKPKKIGR